MRIQSILLLLSALAAPPAAAKPTTRPPADVVRAASSLIARVVPGQARFFVVEQIAAESGLDVLEVESRGDRIVLRGSNGVAIASALNWYLENVAGITVAIPLRPVVIAEPLPRVSARVRIATPYKYRYFFNYCTFSYSMAWWDWTQWQPMIDWMALKGINLPLAATGQEVTWRLTLRDLGFSEKQIADFLVGPAYLPWGWMGNIDGLGGPLPAAAALPSRL